MSHTDMGIVGATTDSFILFENGVRRNRLVFAWIVTYGGTTLPPSLVMSVWRALAPGSLGSRQPMGRR
jgi:hypothetical protein